MDELALYAGCGGGLLGSLLLGWRTRGYVEINDYCQRVIKQRISDGILHDAPIFGDIRAFIDEGYAAAYSGLVDVISGGFPCQPFSSAGKRKGENDKRNLWPETIECIRIVRPRFCFLENVRGLLPSGYFPEILKDLAESGYDARWRVLSAAEVGAPHRRDRLWIVAYAYSERQQKRWLPFTVSPQQPPSQCTSEDVSDTNGQYGVWRGESREPVSQGRETRHQFGGSSADVAYAYSERLEASHQSFWGISEFNAFSTRYGKWWEVEPDVGRLVDGIPHRVDRLKAIGNGQVPLVAATAWHLLTGDIGDE